MSEFFKNLRMSEVLSLWIMLAFIGGVTIDGVHYRLLCSGCHYEIKTEEAAP